MHSHELAVADLTVSYNRIPALHHIDFKVRCGHCVALLGPNGAGKSTLLKALAGLLPLETGTIHFHNHLVRSATQDFAYLPQRENIDWDFPATVRGLVEMGRFLRTGWWRRFSKEDEAAVDEAIRLMQLEDFADRQISALSGGQQQRTFLARSLAQQAHVFLLDEPFTGLDKPNQDNLKALIRQLRDQGKLIIASHHDLGTVPELFDHVVFLNGELIASGPVTEVFTTANIEKTYSRRAFAGPHSHELAH
ncbi:MAG: transporter-related protein [Chthoniobacteraceae bacterium]|nr:transporter-related protein [Chthoniobacteraceae bacterium]MDB6171096.1 transporter-related protein [Chthoniobacteraceae bacterium]